MASSQSIRRGQVLSVCHLCETDPNIKFKCYDCLLLMCQKCRDKIHAKIKNSERHKIVDIKDIGNESDMDFTNLKCEDHLAFCCLFCKSCDQLVCPTCLAKGHKSHDFIEIHEKYQQQLVKVNRIEEWAKYNVNTIKSIRCNLEHFKTMMHDNMDVEEKKMENHRKALKRAVDVHFNKLISDLKSSSEEIQAAVDEDITTMLQVEKDAQAKHDGLLELINTNDSNKFFRDISKMETSQDIIIPETPSTLLSIPRFVPKDINFTNFGELQRDSDVTSSCDQINLQIIQQYQSELDDIADTCSCADGSLWLNSDKLSRVQRVRPGKSKLKVISTVKTIVCGMASTESGDLLLSTGGTRVQQISCKSGQASDTQYDVAPFISTAIHITQEGQVIVGGGNNQGRRAVIVMDRDGRHERTYEHDNHGQPLFFYPYNITTTRNGIIHVADWDPDCDRGGRLKVLSKEGNIVHIYHGHPGVNKAKPFCPVGIATTPGDSVLVVDYPSGYLHLLNNTGHLLTIYDTSDVGIQSPHSLALTSSGSLWIGCTKRDDCSDRGSKLYHVKFSEHKKQTSQN